MFTCFQTRAHGRDWDLSRPDALWIDRPAREGDNDPRLGASSAQLFDGEDLQVMHVLLGIIMSFDFSIILVPVDFELYYCKFKKGQIVQYVTCFSNNV